MQTTTNRADSPGSAGLHDCFNAALVAKWQAGSDQINCAKCAPQIHWRSVKKLLLPLILFVATVQHKIESPSMHCEV